MLSALLFAGLAPLAAAPDLAPLASAEMCGRCHRAIHEAWKRSSHSAAMESRLFQDALEVAENDFGVGARKVCLGCHAPLAVQTGDLSLVKKVSWEGITCDYCHSIKDVALGGPNPKATVAPGLVKTGPLKDSLSDGHGTEFSAVHTSSLVCAPCHEYRNQSGFPVLTTYSEWKSSPAAKDGKECQSCHMSRVAGEVVDPRVSRSKQAKINLHQMPGSHSLEQLTSTVKAGLAAVREGDHLKVTVEVANQSAGHSVPTGSPLRRISLEVQADSYAGHHFKEERVYMRRVADQHGTPLEREHFAFLKAAKVIDDTRLKPGERRSETFSFPVPPGVQTNVKATFVYYYSPTARVESQKRITFLTLNRLIR